MRHPWICPLVVVSATLVAPPPGGVAGEPESLPRGASGELFPPLPPEAAPRPRAASPAPPAPAARAMPVPPVPVVVVDGPAPAAQVPAPAANPAAAAKPADAAEAGYRVPTPAEVARATPEEAGRMFAATEERLKALDQPGGPSKAESQPTREMLEERRKWLLDWRKSAKEHYDVEHPEPSPDRLAADARAELEKCKALLERSATAPDEPLPEIFRAASEKTPEERLKEMKGAIDAARDELKRHNGRLDEIRADAARSASGGTAELRARRDQLHQDFSAVQARRAEREAAVASAASAEGRVLAAERLANFEWEARATAEKLDAQETRIALAARRLDVLSGPQLQAAEARVRLGRKLLDRMERHYTALAEGQRRVLEQAVALEQSRAAAANDPILRHRSRKNAELLALESQVVAYEKAEAATGDRSVQDQTGRADNAETAFAELKKLVDDGNLSPLDALRLQNEYRRTGPERDRVTEVDLARAAAELNEFETALSDAEIDILNDARDDRYEADALLEKLGPGRRPEAQAMLDDLEAKHRDLLNRRRAVLQSLAEHAEAAHAAVVRRIRILDQQNAFIRTHIFWVRDAEPIGKATLVRARGETGRALRSVAGLAVLAFDRTRREPSSASFLAAATVALLLPLPIWLGRRWVDRRRVVTLS